MTRGARGSLGGFQKFILRGNVVDLAVGIVIGAAFTAVVQALVKDLITPMISLFGGAPDFSNFVLTVGNARFAIGDFINVVISFIILALVVYFFVVLPVNTLMEKYKPESEPAPTRVCPECTSKIPEKARRCQYCTAQVATPSPETLEVMRAMASPARTQIADDTAQVLADRQPGRP
jgi:large conductance mechanosensitive channel